MIRILKNDVYDGKKQLQEIAITEETDLANIYKTKLLTGTTVQFLDTVSNKLRIFYFTEKDNDFHEV